MGEVNLDKFNKIAIILFMLLVIVVVVIDRN